MIGDANIKLIATFIGTFFLSNLLETGITAQSHAGKKKPKKMPTIEPRILFLGIILAIVSLDTYVSIIDDMIEKKKKNGKLSKKIDINIIDISFKVLTISSFLMYIIYYIMLVKV